MGFVSNVNIVAQDIDDVTYVSNDINSVKTVADNIDSVKTAAGNIDEVLTTKTDITYGAGVPSNSINPVSGTNAMYVDTNTNTSYICIDATNNSNIWSINGSGQFADVGDSNGRSVPYCVGTTAQNETITVKEGQKAFAIEEIIIAEGSELIIEDGAVFKVL